MSSNQPSQPLQEVPYIRRQNHLRFYIEWKNRPPSSTSDLYSPFELQLIPSVYVFLKIPWFK